MKYDILKSFKGSPDGCHTLQYNEGDKEVELTDSLAEVALKEKWVKPSKAGEKEAKAKAKAEAERLAAEEAAAAEAAALGEAAIAALQNEIAQLKADYEAAEGEEAKATIVAQAEAKQAELDALLAE